jgi:SNF2 family DNA or RNA helicase
MIIIHAAQLNGSLTLWGEDSDPLPSSERLPEAHHPRCASALRLAEAVGIAPGGAAGTEAEATVWLPSRGNSPMPSEALAGPALKSRAKPRIKPWRVPILRLSSGQAIELLQRCQNGRVLSPGIVLSPDVAYWRHVMLFAAALTARQQFLPNVAQNGQNAKAVWTPLYIGDDAHRLAELAKAMPPSARALISADNHRPPTTPPQAVLKEFIASIVNHIIRLDVVEGSAGSDSVHEAWLQALTSADGVVHATAAQLQQLRRQVAEWHRPIAVAANSPYRLCLRLEEPPEPDGDDPPAALREQDWYLRYLIQPHDDHSLLLAVGDAQERLSPDFNPAEFLLTSLAQAGAVCPSIADSLNQRKPAGAKLGAEQAHQFLTQQAAALQQAGFGVMLPSWWTRRGTKNRPTIRAEVRTPPMQGGTNMTMASLIDLNIQVAMGDEVIEPEELLELADLKVPLVRFRGQWVEINADEIRAAADFWRDRDQTTLREVIRIGLGADQQAEADNVSLSTDGWLDDLLESLQQKGKIELLDAPQEFNGELRPYQQLGYSWLDFLRWWGLGACLADDMGLGKTIQTLAAILRDHQQGNERPNLLVCPTSVINNWQREAQKFTPSLPVMLHHGPGRERGEKFAQQAANHQIVITSYGTMTRDRELLASVDWRSVTLDEAQNIKNPVTRQAQAARSLPADYRIALTGTPVENHVGDLWAIMQFLNPGLLGSQAEFKRRYFNPIQVNRDDEAAAKLQKATGPFILRRLKTDPTIIDDLPDKHETKQYCNLTREQVTLYEAVLRDVETRLEDAEGMARRGSILDTLVKLKQVCNHPRQLLGDNSSIAGRSGKLARLEELLDEIIPAGDRVLVFSQFAEMGTIIQQHVQETYGLETPMLHGGVSRKNRDRMVERFQNDPHGPQVFVLSLKAGGSGLNLPRANHVIHYDRWWNPAVENQATERAFRIGQTRDVHVHKMICAGTLEDRIDLMIEAKQQTADQVVGATSERWLTELSNTELREVLALSATPED